jgi:phosphoglycerate dehydrogenase-like enzyme
MSGKREWDLTSTHSLESGAEWLRMKAGALCVVVVRVEDAVLAADPGLSASDAEELVAGYMMKLARDLESARREKRRAARLELGALSE